jgi:hypothetical protein
MMLLRLFLVIVYAKIVKIKYSRITAELTGLSHDRINESLLFFRIVNNYHRDISFLVYVLYQDHIKHLKQKSFYSCFIKNQKLFQILINSFFFQYTDDRNIGIFTNLIYYYSDIILSISNCKWCLNQSNQL